MSIDQSEVTQSREQPSRPVDSQLGAEPATLHPVSDRVLLPLLFPILAILAVALYVLNISRVFLAGGNGAGSLITAAIVTIAILVGSAVVSAIPQLRSSTLTIAVALLMVIVVSAGLITLGPSEDHGEGGTAEGYQEPAGALTAMLTVNAGPGTDFQADQFTVPAGILEITYADKGVSHTLVFQEAEFAGFKLAVPQGPPKRKVDITEGEYTIFCDIPGHRAAGMDASLTVTPAPASALPEPGGPPRGERALVTSAAL